MITATRAVWLRGVIYLLSPGFFIFKTETSRADAEPFLLQLHSSPGGQRWSISGPGPTGKQLHNWRLGGTFTAPLKGKGRGGKGRKGDGKEGKRAAPLTTLFC